jgi:hypothetical protein
MDKAVASRRRKTAEEMKAAEKAFDANGRSRFFGAAPEPNSEPETPGSGSTPREPVTALQSQQMEIINRDEETLVVEQETGYRSPSFSTAPFVSSPTKATEDESRPSMLGTHLTNPLATLILGIPDTPTASRNSAGAVAGQPAYELSIDLEQIFSQGSEDAGVEETQLISQGSSRAGSSFEDLEQNYDTSGHTTDAVEAEDCGVSESDYGVPESDVEVVVPRKPSIELIELAEESADEVIARTEVVARGWRTRFTLAAMVGRSAPGEEKRVNVIFSL